MTRTLFMIFITFNTLSTYNCLSMELEKEDKIITLDQGLLTVIPAKMTYNKYITEGWLTTKKIYCFTEKKDSVINLLHYNRCTSSGCPYTDHEYFNPLIIKLTIESSIKHLGEFDKHTHHEIKEAIRERKALYYTRKQGILIYSLNEQPDPSIVTHIDRMLEDNKEQMKIPQ
jgi:hypothetical protein